jgi:hypothetical protein
LANPGNPNKKYGKTKIPETQTKNPKRNPIKKIRNTNKIELKF